MYQTGPIQHLWHHVPAPAHGRYWTDIGSIGPIPAPLAYHDMLAGQITVYIAAPHDRQVCQESLKMSVLGTKVWDPSGIFLVSAVYLRPCIPETFWYFVPVSHIQWRPFITRFIIANILSSSILISLHNMLPFELTKDTPYLALSGELWSVFYEYFNRNWSCYKGFPLYTVNVSD